MSLDDLLNQVMRMKSSGKRALLLSDEEQGSVYNTNIKKYKVFRKRSLVAYGLGSKYGDAYFTRREAECMVLLLNGKTTNSIAAILELSRSTVIDYIKNMKIKVGCRTKLELINLVSVSEFPKNVNF